MACTLQAPCGGQVREVYRDRDRVVRQCMNGHTHAEGVVPPPDREHGPDPGEYLTPPWRKPALKPKFKTSEAQLRYLRSEKGRAAYARYRRTAKSKAAQTRYRLSEKGRATYARTNARHWERQKAAAA